MTLIDDLFPNYCVACGKEIGYKSFLCEDCTGSLKGPVYLDFKLPWIDQGHFFWWYESPLKEIIRAYKFERRYRLSNCLANYLFEMFCSFSPEFDAIVPVPTTISALGERGYDTNRLILKKLKKKFVFTEDQVLVARNKKVPQSSLGGKERKKNIEGKFAIRKEPVPERVLLFDDVVTTGSTVIECAKLLKRNGAKEITLFTIGRADK